MLGKHGTIQRPWEGLALVAWGTLLLSLGKREMHVAMDSSVEGGLEHPYSVASVLP